MGATVRAILTQPIISCVTSCMLLKTRLNFSIFLFHVVHAGKYTLKKKIKRRQSKASKQTKNRQQKKKLQQNQNQILASTGLCRRAFRKQKYQYVNVGLACSVWGWKTETIEACSPTGAQHPSHPQILGCRCGRVSVPEFLGYHVQTSSTRCQTTLWGFWRKYLMCNL